MIPTEKIREWLFLALVVLAPFSLFPSVALPTANFTSFRIGAYQILALAFIILCIADAIRDYITRKHTKEDRFVYGAITVLCAASAYQLTDAIDPNRGLLMTAAFCFLLVLVLCARWFVRERIDLMERLKPLLVRFGILYGVVSIIQLLIATFSDKGVLLCGGCSSEVFGFARINGFAAEPLFWANALIPFWIFALDAYSKLKSRIHLLSLALLTISITLTFSRGAYFAVACIGIAYFIRRRTLENLRTIIVIGCAVLVAFSMMVVSANIKYRALDGVGRETISGIIEHLSFGKLSVAKPKPATSNAEQVPPSEFDSEGYVEASTTDRTTSADLALTAWRRPENVLFGVGLGNLGPYVVRYVNEGAPANLTVYIYYVLLLVEAGIVGLALVLGLYVTAFRRLWHKGGMAELVMLVLVGFLAHYFFFGSYINVVYIWLWLGIALGLTLPNPKKRPSK